MKFCGTLTSCLPARLPFALAALLFSSCQQPTLIDPEVPRANRGRTLTVRLEPGADTPAMRAALGRFGREWSASTGAAVGVDPKGVAGEADVRVFPACDLLSLADKLEPVPAELRSSQHPWYRFSDLIPWISSRIVVAEGAAKALPLLGEGQVLIGRGDAMARFLPEWQKLYPGLALDLPATWEDLAAQAEFYAKQTGRPALEPLSDPADLERLFYSIAVDYDRFLLTESARGSRLPTREEEDLLFGWHYNPSTARPRIDSPAFVHALTILKRLVRASGPRTPSTVLGVVTLPQLAEILREPADRSQTVVGPLPGAGFVFDPARPGEKLPVPGTLPNRIPYLGWGTLLGGVSAASPNADIAFDFLARLGHPSETALSLVSDGTLGAGPIRTSQVEAGRPVWSGYRLPTEQTDRLITSLRPLMARGVVNARYVLRLPDQKAKSAILRDAIGGFVAEAAGGKRTPEGVLREARAEWEKLDVANPDLPRQLRKSLNL